MEIKAEVQGERIVVDLKNGIREDSRNVESNKIGLKTCEKICKELAKNGIRFYAGIFIPTLIDDCEGWEEEEISISE